MWAWPSQLIIVPTTSGIIRWEQENLPQHFTQIPLARMWSRDFSQLQGRLGNVVPTQL